MYKCVFIILFAWLIPLQAQNNNGTASPESLVRRLFLDLYNRLPMEDEYLKAKGKIEKNQYNQLIAEMLKTSEFQKNLAAKIIDLLFLGGSDHFGPDYPCRKSSTMVKKTKLIIFAAGMVWRPGEIHHQINEIPDQTDYFCIQDATDYFSGPKYAG